MTPTTARVTETAAFTDTGMNDHDLTADLLKASSDHDRVLLISNQIEAKQAAILKMRVELAMAEGEVEGLVRLRETLGCPKLTPKHTLRARVQKYLEKFPGAGTSQIATSLGAPVTTVSMCLGRNKDLFEQAPGEGWRNKP